PIVKWAGGKRQLLDELVARVPAKFNAYHEFFLGGGALFFELYNKGLVKHAVLSDINPVLINLYKVVQKQPDALVEELKNRKYANNERAFYDLRKSEPSDKVEMAARFVYLNKTAFNGLYRPFAFQAMQAFLDAGFVLKEDIIKAQHNCSATGFWRSQARKFNFHLIMH
ncbi:MAG: Dam family site-specific DNA-(adenine-N6)-methyltransferase, partial [Candidatus Micrarchaeia archaeon]